MVFLGLIYCRITKNISIYTLLMSTKIQTTYYDTGQLKYQGATEVDSHHLFEETTWYENGQKYSNATYTITDNLINLMSWYENGQLKYEVVDHLMDKTFKSWYENGQLMFCKELLFDFSDVFTLKFEEWFDEEGNSIEPLLKYPSRSYEEIQELMEFLEFYKPDDDRILGSKFLYIHL